MRTLLLVVLSWSLVAHAAEPAPTPPDVLHGERYDGLPQRRSTKKYWLAVPRALLAVPRLTLKGIGAVAKPAMELSERYHIPERVNAVITSQDGLIGVRPIVNYEQGFEPSFGALYFNRRLPHHAEATVSSAIGGPELLLEDVRAAVPLAQKIKLEAHVDYQRRNDELFTGIGMKSGLPFARYAFDAVDASVAVTFTPIKRLRAELATSAGLRRFGDGVLYDGDAPIAEVYCARSVDGRCARARVDETLVPGFNRGTQFLRQSAAIHVDSRKNELSSGLLLDAGLQYTHGLGFDRSSYIRMRGRIGESFEIYHHRTLYVGIAVEDEVAFGATPIPFSELVQLGGIDDLRGFRRGRFRDASSVLATAEYRWPIWMWMDGCLFVDYGGVFGPQLAGLDLKALRPDIGFGVRVHSSDKLMMRLQVAYGFGDGGGGGIRLVIAGNGNPS
jgi:hypothetical protein